MNKPNQAFKNYYNEALLRTKSYFRDIQETNNALSSLNPSSTYLNHNYLTTANPTSLTNPLSDTSICDGMSNCHLTESWTNYQHANLPLTHISNNIPILNSYTPLQRGEEFEVSSTNLTYNHHQLESSSSQHHQLQQNQYIHHQQQQLQQNYYLYYKNYLESFYNSFNHHNYVKMTANSATETHPQQYLMRDGFSRRDELDYEQSKAEKSFLDDNAPIEANTLNVVETDFHQKIKTSIKYQDRNKKLDFKVNFRDENRKVNGCFYDSESISPRSHPDHTMELSLTPPKKKWLKTHYLTSQTGIFLDIFGEHKGRINRTLSYRMYFKFWSEITGILYNHQLSIHIVLDLSNSVLLKIFL